MRIIATSHVVYIGERAGGVCELRRDHSIAYWTAHTGRLADMCYDAKHNVLVTVAVGWNLVDSHHKFSHYSSTAIRMRPHN